MPLLEEGMRIRDTYVVERFLGEGAFAEVYRVNHKFLGRQAMKVFKQTCRHADEVTKMLGEAILLSRMGHPNIVRVFDANTLSVSSVESGGGGAYPWLLHNGVHPWRDACSLQAFIRG